MKKFYAVLLVLIILFSNILTVYAGSLQIQSDAKAFVLMDYNTGQILQEKNADEKLKSANLSTTMVILLLLEAFDGGKIQESDIVQVSGSAWKATGSKVFLDLNESYSAGELLKAVIVASANDAAIALAEKIYLNEQEFVNQMNERANSLGLVSTHFSSIYGIDSDDQYTCAKDMAVIMREISSHALYFKSSGIWLDTFTHPSGRTTEMTNLNKMVRNYSGCDGGKTGSSSSAGFCLAVTAKRAADRYIYVCLGDTSGTSRFSNAGTAFDYAFNNYTGKTPVKEGKTVVRDVIVEKGMIKKIDGIAKESVSLLLDRSQGENLEKQINIYENLTAPIEKGQKIGEIIILNNGIEIGKTDIISSAEVLEITYKNSINRIMLKWLRV